RLGMGHVFRALALAHELASHDVVIVTRSDGPYALGAEYLRRTPYRIETLTTEEQFLPYCKSRSPDITVLDVLDTSEEFVRSLAECSGFVVSFEDLGPGARLADVVINDLYTDFLPAENHWYGVQHAVLAQ